MSCQALQGSLYPEWQVCCRTTTEYAAWFAKAARPVKCQIIALDSSVALLDLGAIIRLLHQSIMLLHGVMWSHVSCKLHPQLSQIFLCFLTAVRDWVAGRSTSWQLWETQSLCSGSLRLEQTSTSGAERVSTAK